MRPMHLFVWLALAVTGAAGAQETPVTYPHAAVAADHVLASRAGVEILRAGGNAVDAAVATSFALSVVRPYSCGIGGGGFMVIRLKKHPRLGAVTTAINYRETGPAWVKPDSFEAEPDPDAATHGGKAVCIPGTVAGLLYALEKYGTMPRERVLAPAVRLAEEGFEVDRHYADTAHDDELVIPWFEKDRKRTEEYAYLWKRLLMEGRVKAGDRMHVPEQARVLRLIAAKGAEGFYMGDVAESIVAAVKRHRGAMTLDDLAAYRVHEMEPLRTSFRGMEVLTMPPPSSGGVVLAQVFAMLDARRADLDAIVAAGGHDSVPYVHLVTEAFKHSFADRARWMGDPNFVSVPVKQLLAPSYIRSRADAIDMTRTGNTGDYGTAQLPDDAGTSHFCVVDADGGAVACTETINLIFGSFVAVEGYGFILNDEMDDFLTRGGHANAFGLEHADKNRPMPGKRPLSSMTPTMIVDAGGGVRLLAGGAGGPRIISATIEAALNATLWDMTAEEAVSAPRFHHQWHPDRLDLEEALRGGELEAGLKSLGHTTALRKAIGNVQMIRRGAKGWEGGCDPRKGGEPAGY